MKQWILQNILRNISITAVVFMILPLFLTGCSHAPEVNTALLQNSSGDFQYEDLVWGIDKASAEAGLNITLDQTVNQNDQLQSYLAQDAYVLMGLPATVTCEFDMSGLCSVNFRVSPSTEESQQYWENLTNALLAQYGSTDPLYTDSSSASGQIAQLNVQTESYLWEASNATHTALCIRKVSVNGKSPSIELIVYVIPADRGQ